MRHGMPSQIFGLRISGMLAVFAMAFLGCIKNGTRESTSGNSLAGKTTIASAHYDDEEDTGKANRSNFGPGRFQSDFRKSPHFPSANGNGTVKSGPRLTSRVWVSANLLRSVNNGKRVAPEGSVAIKEMESGSKLGVMIKMGAGYDPKGGDWYYEVRNAEGELQRNPPSGKVVACTQCHAKFADDDFLPGVINTRLAH